MKRPWLRMLMLGAALSALLLGVGAWLLVRGIDGNAVLARAAREVHAATGRDLAVDGPLRLKLLPRIALEAHGVRLGNAAWGSQPDMARIGTLRMVVALAPLLQRRVEIDRIELSDADLLLETDAQGLGNWSFAAQAAPAAHGDDPAEAPSAAAPSRPGRIRLGLANLTVHDSRLTVRNGRTGRAGPAEPLLIESLALTQEGSSRRWQLALQAQWRARELGAKGWVGLQEDAATKTRSVPLEVALTLDGASAEVKGALGLGSQAGQGRLKVNAQIRRKDALAPVLGMTLPLPMPANVRAELDWQRRRLVADPFELETQGQSVTGRVAWNGAASPAELQLSLRADGLDLARLYPPVKAPAGIDSPDDGHLLSDAALPELHLPALAIQADLRTERLVLPNGLELASVKAIGRGVADRVDVEQLQFGLARGTFHAAGHWRQSAGSNAVAPRLGLQLQARGVAMDALLAVLRREAPISGGRTDIEAQLTGSGHSLRALAASLDGEVRMRMGPATSIGRARSSGPGDLVAAVLHALTPMRDSAERVQVRCAAARLPLRRGHIEIDRAIAVESERVDLVMSGTMDLGSERLDLAMRPTVRKGTGLDPGAFAGMVKIGGTFAAPHVEANLAGTAREALSIGAAVASSGVTLLGERVLGRVNDPHPCDTAYKGGGAAPAAGRPETRAEADDDGPLRRLFGR